MYKIYLSSQFSMLLTYYKAVMTLYIFLSLFICRRQLAKQAQEERIENESYEAFASRVKAAINSVPIALIDKTIESLPKRMEMVVKCGGRRIKY